MKHFIYIWLFLNLIDVKAQNRQFYKEIVNSTILLNKKDKSSNIIPHGAGFVLYNSDSTSSDIILVTCKHLTFLDTLFATIPAADSIKNEMRRANKSFIIIDSGKDKIVVRFDGDNFIFPIPLKSGNNLFTHDNLDLAIIYCKIASGLKNGYQNIILSEQICLPSSLISGYEDIYTGQDVIFLGFPYQIGTKFGYNGTYYFSDKVANPLARKGIIAWTSRNSDIFLIDGFSFSGNSGSPIFSIPNFEDEGKLVGMVLGDLKDTFVIKNVEVNKLNGNLATTLRVIDFNNLLAYFIPSYIIMKFKLESDRRRNLIRMYEASKNASE